MSRHYTHLLPILIIAWALYGYCQEDYILPLAAAGIALVGHLSRINQEEKRYAFMQRVPAAAIFVFSLIAAILWRILVPAPVTAGALYLEVISVWQSFCIIAAMLFWLRPATLRNMYWLTGFSWAGVAVSINVPFDDVAMLLFRLFCIFSVINVIIHTYTRPQRADRYRLHLRQLLIFGLLVMVITGFFFKHIALGLRVFDRMFMSLIGDYILPRSYTNFLNISPTLRLTNPGYSAVDKRPVMEIDSMGFGSVYLKTQVFETYDDGVWKESKEVAKKLLPQQLNRQRNAEIFMYVALKDIIPAPYVVGALQGHDVFSQDANDVVTADEVRRTRIMTVSVIMPLSVTLDAERFRALTSVPPSMEPALKEISGAVVTPEMVPVEKATALQKYLRDNFRYSLNVDFRADEKGLIEMLRRKKPAYCSYFATALTLLLRSQGIPARVGTGFYTSEKLDRDGHRLLVRVRHAHAWTEVLVPFRNTITGAVYNTWIPFDGTPSSMSEVIEDSSSRFNDLADRLWLFMLRSLTRFHDIDKEELKRGILLLLILILLAMNFRRILRRLRGIRPRRGRDRAHLPAGRGEAAAFYGRYEQFIQRRFREARERAETDDQLLERLSQRKDVGAKTLVNMRHFIAQYRRVRFGDEKNEDLGQILIVLERDGQ